MYIPTFQSVLTASIACTGLLTKPLSVPPTASTISKGKIMDYAVEKCIDGDGNQRCSAPFLVSKNTCYELDWSTEGTFTHTTVEVRDAKSAEIVYYRDTNGQWTAEKGELVYLDFKPKIYNTGNDTVTYKVTTCHD